MDLHHLLLAGLPAHSCADPDTAKLPLSLIDGSFLLYSSTYVQFIGSSYATLSGKGFKAKSWGPLTAGTVKDIDFYLKDKFVLSVSKISIPATSVIGWGDKAPADVARTIFAGKDTITGSSKGTGWTGLPAMTRFQAGMVQII